MALTQRERDARRDTVLVRIGKALLALIKADAKRENETARNVMEQILRNRYRGKI